MNNNNVGDFNYADVEKHRLVVGVIYVLVIGSLWLPWIEHNFGHGISTTTHAFLDDGAYLMSAVAVIGALVVVLAGGMKKPMTLITKIISAIIGGGGVVVTFMSMDMIDFGSTSPAWGANVTMALFILAVVAVFIPSSVIEKLVPGDLGSALDTLADDGDEVIIQEVEKSSSEQLKELKELLDAGIITDDEFETKKKELLDL